MCIVSYINNENSSDNCINNNKIPLKNWIYMGTYENGEEITHWYISDVRRMTNSYNNAIYNYLGITFPSKYEESFTVDFSSAGSFDRVDCSSKSLHSISFDRTYL